MSQKNINPISGGLRIFQSANLMYLYMFGDFCRIHTSVHAIWSISDLSALIHTTSCPLLSSSPDLFALPALLFVFAFIFSISASPSSSQSQVWTRMVPLDYRHLLPCDSQHFWFLRTSSMVHTNRFCSYEPEISCTLWIMYLSWFWFQLDYVFILVSSWLVIVYLFRIVE